MKTLRVHRRVLCFRSEPNLGGTTSRNARPKNRTGVFIFPGPSIRETLPAEHGQEQEILAVLNSFR
jgi:hypothetical protein